jgi:hypothetical protein
MAEVPKIVRERLKVPSPTGNHLDADLLTAYSEQMLSKRERTIVLEHLSRCADCRAVVALALPASEVVQALPRPSRSWLAWPAFRWGFASAGLAVIAIFASLQYRHQSAPELTQKTAAPALEAKTEPTPPISAAEEKAPPAGRKAKSDVSKDAAATQVDDFMVANKRADKSGAANQPATAGGLVVSRDKLPHGPLQSNQWQQQNAYLKQGPAPEMRVANRLAAAPAPVPPQAGAQSASSPIDPIQSAPPGDRGTQNLDLAVNNETSTHLQPAEAEVEKAKPAMPGPAPKNAGDGDSAAMQARAGKALATNTPRWTINSSGGLQRSYDQGISWQDVSVTSAPVSANATMELSAPTRAKAASSTAVTLAKREQPSPPVFRTVAANGLEVWAGGAKGLLYHSTDAGAHWTHVVPSAGGAVVAGDILTIEFPDALHGRIVTSAGETWITSDRGLTWQRQ